MNCFLFSLLASQAEEFLGPMDRSTFARHVRPGAQLSDLIGDKVVFSEKPCIEENEWAIYLGTFIIWPMDYLTDSLILKLFAHGLLSIFVIPVP